MPTVKVDPFLVKDQTDEKLQNLGIRVPSWLPAIEQSEMRGLDQLVGRALTMNALLAIYFGAPIPVIKTWIHNNGLDHHLSNSECNILIKDNAQLTKSEVTNLYGYIEGLWALMWVGGLIDVLDFTHPIDDTMVLLVPNLQVNEDGSKFKRKMKLRPYSELFAMLDLSYRLHWYARDGSLHGYSTEPISLDIVVERRKALEWLMDQSADWDHINLST